MTDETGFFVDDKRFVDDGTNRCFHYYAFWLLARFYLLLHLQQYFRFVLIRSVCRVSWFYRDALDIDIFAELVAYFLSQIVGVRAAKVKCIDRTVCFKVFFEVATESFEQLFGDFVRCLLIRVWISKQYACCKCRCK